MISAQQTTTRRHCLVTVGATVGFPHLTESVLQPEFWVYLAHQGYTSLHIQCGPDRPWAQDRLSSSRHDIPDGLMVEVFETKDNLAVEEMALCRAIDGVQLPGIIISHAGQKTRASEDPSFFFLTVTDCRE